MKNEKGMLEKNTRFAIKKLSIGAAAVLVSTSMYLGMRSNDVLADTNTSNENGEVTNNNSEPTETKKITVVSTSDFEGSDSITPASLAESKAVEPPKAAVQTTEQTLNSAPVYTTQGQVPTLDIHALFTQDQLDQDQIDTEDDSTSLTWEQTPDVSKIGNTTGVAKLSYANYDADPTTNDEGEEVYPLKDITVNVPVLVRKAEQEVGQDQVKNSLNIINTTDNSLVAHYEWVGTKAKNDDEEEPIPNSDSISEDITNMLQSLGFEMDNYSYFPSDITNFGTKNKVATIFVKPSSTNPTAPVITDTPYFTYSGGDTSSINNVTETPDPASYIGNLGTLPAGTKIEWNEAPKYDYTKDEDGNWLNEAPTNKPSIKVTLPNQKTPIILAASSEGTPLKDIAILPAYGDGTLLFSSKNELKIGNTIDEIGSPFKYVTNLEQYLKSDHAPEDVQAFKDSFKWTLAPNTQQAGYTLGAFTYSDNDGIMYGNQILFKANPISVNNSKTITRTITFEGLPQDLSPEAVSQKVTFTQNGEQTYVDQPIDWKPDKNTWGEYVVPPVLGYTPSQASVAAQTVKPGDKDLTFVITYTANSHTQVVNYVDKTDKIIGTYNVSGKTAEKVDTDIEKKVPEGYAIVEGQEIPTSVTFGANDPAPIKVIVVKKETATDTPEPVSNKVASVVIYQTEDGKVVKTDVKEQKPGDKVEFNVPDGYVPADKLPDVTVTSDMKPITIIVVKQETPDTPPAGPQPSQPTPSDPEPDQKPDIPTTPSDPDPVVPDTETTGTHAGNISTALIESTPVKASGVDEDTAKVGSANNEKSQNTLPQTGSKSLTGILLGSVLLAAILALGFVNKRKRN